MKSLSLSNSCNPMDCSLPGSSVHGIFQARVLEWVAVSFSRGSSQPRDRTGSPALQADALSSEPPGKPPTPHKKMPATAAKSLQSCPTLCDPTDSSPQAPHPWDSPGKNTGVGCHFLLQCMKVKSESEVTQSCPTLWTAAFQAHPSMGFSRQEYWSGVPLPRCI